MSSDGFFLFIYFNWRIITILWRFLPTSTWISHGYTCTPPILNPPSPLPPHPIPLGCPRALALSAQLHASNSNWPSNLHMAMCKFQCYFLKSSHPLLLLLSSKVCSLHPCLLCCPGCRITSTIFLNSILCVNIQYLSPSSWLTSLCLIGSRFIHLFRTNSNAFLFIAE